MFKGQPQAIVLFKVSGMNHEGDEVFMTAANYWISEEVRRQLDARPFPAGSIVFTKVGAGDFLGRKRFSSRASCINSNMAAFVVDRSRLKPQLAHLALLNAALGSLCEHDSTVICQRHRGLAQIELRLPLLPEQVAIAEVLSDMGVEIGALEQRCDKTSLLKQGMMQELLTGRTRLA